MIKQAIADMNCELMQFYGATETSGAGTLLRPNEHDFNNEQNLKSCGTPLPLIEIRVVDPEGARRRRWRDGRIPDLHSLHLQRVF